MHPICIPRYKNNNIKAFIYCNVQNMEVLLIMEERKPIVKVKPDTAHNIILESRKKLSVSAVEEIISFNDEEIILATSMGVLEISGKELHIHKLSVESGETVISGTVEELKYVDSQGEKSEGFFAKLFK